MAFGVKEQNFFKATMKERERVFKEIPEDSVLETMK
tara:strand:- start:9 stop:116 length:108 start_codon:yes stop_codon:yes gene_type:complete